MFFLYQITFSFFTLFKINYEEKLLKLDQWPEGLCCRVRVTLKTSAKLHLVTKDTSILLPITWKFAEKAGYKKNVELFSVLTSPYYQQL